MRSGSSTSGTKAAAASEDVIKRWRGNAGPGRIVFKDAAGQDVTIPLSLRGFPQALDALAKEARP